MNHSAQSYFGRSAVCLILLLSEIKALFSFSKSYFSKKFDFSARSVSGRDLTIEGSSRLKTNKNSSLLLLLHEMGKLKYLCIQRQQGDLTFLLSMALELLVVPNNEQFYIVHFVISVTTK